MYASTNPGSSHGDFQDRNGVNYVSSAESFGHCAQLFWKKDPNDSGVRKPLPPIVSGLHHTTAAPVDPQKHELNRQINHYSKSYDPSATISWCDQLPPSSAALSSTSLSPPSLSSPGLSLETAAPPPPPAPAAPPSAPPTPATDIAPAPDDSESDERPYVCDLCNCAYKHASSLLNHKLTHKIGDFKCDFCSKPYTNYMSLRNHMRIHGQKRYMCDLCGKAFRLARYLRNHQRIHDDGPNRFDCPSCCKSYRTMLELAQHRCSAAASNQNKFSCPSCFKSYRTMLDLAQHRCSAAAKNQTSSRRSNFSAPRRHLQQQNNSMMPPQHPAHGPQEPLPSHCVSPMPQGAPGSGVNSQTVPDHQVCPSAVSSQSGPQSMRSSSKLVSSPSPAPPSASYSLLQPLVQPEVKEMSSGYTRLSANPMTKHQDSFSLAPQRPLSSINPLGHSLHPNGAASLKPSPVPRSLQPMPWEQRSLYNQ